MKKILVTLMLALVCTLGAHAAGARLTPLLDGAITVATPTVTAEGSHLELVMTINLSALKVRHEETFTLRPALVSAGGDTTALDSVLILGRNAILRRQRANGLPSHLPANIIDATGRLKSLLYRDSIGLTPYNTSGSVIISVVSRRKASDPDVEHSPVIVGSYHLAMPSFIPEYVYAIPSVPTAKTREYTHRVNLRFPEGKSVITREGDNGAEIDSLCNFVSRLSARGGRPVTSIVVSNVSAPGQYKGNDALPAERVDRLGALLARRFPALSELISSNVTIDDWQGLDSWVERSSLQNRDSILSIIERSDLDTDARLKLLNSRHPDQADFLREVIFPLLDHLSVTVTTTAPNVSNISDIERIYSRNPEDLSLYELCRYFDYLNSRRVSGSDDVLLKSVELYPDDPRARINAANVMMSRGNLVEAQIYLSRAGSSPEAIYARGILYAISGDLHRARENFINARAMGILQADRALKILDQMSQF